MSDQDFKTKNGITVNASLIYATGGSGQVGINTNSPDANLTVVGTANVRGNLTVTGNIIGTAANTLFVGTVTAANVVSNAQLTANLANYATTSSLAANLANYPNTTNLSANLANYQTTAGLAANVAVMTANNANNLGGQLPSYYANATSFTGTFNGSVIGGTAVTAPNGFVQAQQIALKVIANATYTLANSDSGSILLCTNTTSNTVITVPATLQPNTRYLITRITSINVNVSNSAGLTLGSRTANYNILSQYGSISILMANTTLAIIDGNV